MTHETSKSWKAARKRDDVFASLFADRSYSMYTRKPEELERDLYEMQKIAAKAGEARDELINALREVRYTLAELSAHPNFWDLSQDMKKIDDAIAKATQ